MTFKLSQRSLDKLKGVNDDLVYITQDAIGLSKVDFGVYYGLRTEAEQRELFESGASKTMKSKHLTGHAVDLMAYVGSKGSWALNLYDDIADAMAQAARNNNVGLRWGAAWHIPDIRDWDGTMEEAMNSYIDLRRSEGRRPFIDAVHFELVV